MKNNEFKCVICEKTFEKAQTEEEAEAELEDNYPGYSTEECELVCGDCYDIPYFKKERKMRNYEGI